MGLVQPVVSCMAVPGGVDVLRTSTDVAHSAGRLRIKQSRSYRALGRFPCSLDTQRVGVCCLYHSSPAGFAGFLFDVTRQS